MSKVNCEKIGVKTMKSWQIRLAIQKCEGQITANRSSINKAERSYESLAAFRSRVSSYQADFATGSTGKSQALDAVFAISSDCDAASRYYRGMKGLVDRNATKIVNILLEGLLRSTRSSMQDNLDEISNLEAKNQSLQRQIDQLQKDLQIAEMNEAFAEANE